MTPKIHNSNALLYSVLFFSFLSFNILAQVGLGTTTPRGALDISSSTQGMIPPQVALISLTSQSPIVNPQGGNITNGTMVWNTNTAGTTPTNVTPGLYYWLNTTWISVAGSPGGLDWSITGNGGLDGGLTGTAITNATAGTHFLGTTDNTNIDIRTNGTHVVRVSSLGEVFIGALETVLPGDLVNAVGIGNATFPWALNGYTDQDGSAVYGLIQSGSTAYAAVQGEYEGTNSQGSGVRGISSATTAGTNFTTDIGSGLHGTLQNTVSRTFGVKGDTGANSTRRVGGVIGTNFFASGALGYYANNGNDYAVYAFGGSRTNGNSGGRLSNSPNSNNYVDTSIGLGIHGGVIGAWVKGHEYGTIFTGDRFANYNQGKTITNDAFIVLNKKQDGSKSISYASTSMSQDVISKGMGELTNGTCYIAFKKEYAELITNNKPIIVTITPYGESKGLHIVSVDKNGFSIKENQEGTSNITFNWVVIAEKKVRTKAISPEILRASFDTNLKGIMMSETKDDSHRKAIWSDNGTVYFGVEAVENPWKLQNMREKENTQRPKKVKE